MTESSLDSRNHFEHDNSGFSSLRRTLGALLKSKLRLRAIPRAQGPSKTNVTNYRFTEAGERKLTKWMKQNLMYSYTPVKLDIISREKDLIKSLEPPLNLTGWRNPQRNDLKLLRAKCRDEARQKH
jgi:hypothetical protein